MTKKKHKAKPRAKLQEIREIIGPQWPGDWILMGQALPKYDRPVLVTDGAEFAHAARDHTDRHGEHFSLVDNGAEFTDVIAWMEEPLLPNGKPPRHSR